MSTKKMGLGIARKEKTPEHIAKMKEAMKGKTFSEEHNKNKVKSWRINLAKREINPETGRVRKAVTQKEINQRFKKITKYRDKGYSFSKIANLMDLSVSTVYSFYKKYIK